MALAQRALGNMYLNGHGVELDYELGRTWTKAAADQGDGMAQNNMGVIYLQGLGVEANIEQARYWLTLAVEQDIEVAKEPLRLLNEAMAEQGG